MMQRVPESSALYSATRHALVAALILFGATATAVAEDSRKWDYELTPYFWGASLDGDTRVAGLPPARIDEPFSEIFKSLSLGVMGTFEARTDRFGLLLDGLYIRLTDSMTTPGAAFGDVSGTVTQQLYSAAVAYRVSTAPVTVDALGGLRYTDLRVGLELTQGLLAGRSGEAHENWLDFVVGVRAAAPIGSDWSVIGHFDVGGGRSSTTWQAIVGANFAINPGFGLKVGCRYLSVDYDTDEFLYDMATKGPYLGVGIRF